MSKKSALTAALTGGPNPAPGAGTAATPTTKAPKLSLDEAAFPCLGWAAKEASSIAEQSEVTSEAAAANGGGGLGSGGMPQSEGPGGALADHVGRIDLSGLTLAGSAPTYALLSNGTPAADYPLNPYRRRGGKEEVPGSVPASYQDKNGGWSLQPSSSFSTNLLSEAVIGSLPQGMTEEQRLRILQSTPMSPALQSLQELSQAKLYSRSPEGQKMRRRVLRGAVIVFVTAGYSGKRFIFEKAKELGARTIVLDGPDSWAQLMEKEGTIEKFLPIDFSDAQAVFQRCVESIKRATSRMSGIDGITTFCEMAVPLVSRLAETLGLPCNSPAAVDGARDKYSTRAAMAATGLPNPRNTLINSPDDIDKAATHVGFPAVIKPISGAASIGVIRVDNLKELNAAYVRVETDMRKARVVAGALVEGNDDDGTVESGNGKNGIGNTEGWIKPQFMLEEYLDGPEVDCDLIFSNGACVYGAITDNWPTVEPYFNETGSNCPSMLPHTLQRELLELSVNAVKALGLTLGVFHVECKATSRGPRLIEVNCRMGGGPVRDTNFLVWGVDLVEEHLLTSTGVPSRPPAAKKPLMEIAEYSINAEVTGIMRHIDFLKPWQNHPDVLYAKYLVKKGDRCVSVQDGLPTWVCELMVTKPTVKEAVDFIKSIEESMEIPIDKK